MGNITGRDSEETKKKQPQGGGTRSKPPLRKESSLAAVEAKAVGAQIPEKPPALNGSQGSPGSQKLLASQKDILEKRLDELCSKQEVPMIFRWEGGGKNVYITGTFNQWAEKVPMHRSGNDFTYIHDLKKGKHAFKFIVDDEWRFAPEQPTVADTSGYINNFIDLSQFEKTFGNDPTAFTLSRNSIEQLPYQDLKAPDPDDPQWYTKEPPQLPPHLRHIILNAKTPPNGGGSNAMPDPQHVTLNHLYCSAIKDNLMVLGVTTRYRSKFVTTVYYSPLPTTKT